MIIKYDYQSDTTLLLRPLNITSEFHVDLIKPMVLVNLVAIYIGRSNRWGVGHSF